jgi:DNA invertase Pin-like site-specific DNA recombinase
MRKSGAAASFPSSGSGIGQIPCAIYTRKSSEEGLEQHFNSLDAQREACEAFILSQKAEGWFALPNPYDDGGFSGGNMERPGLQQLMRDIASKKVRIVVVYKVDRLTRSLADFAKLVEVFDAHGVSFVSVTQQFNTTSSMGRLTLNVLLSFAQFEREVTGERIRDKIAASKARGMWMGGMPPVGYAVKDKALIIEESSASLVREIYRRYLDCGNVRTLKSEIDRLGWVTPARISRRQGQSGGRPLSRGHLYRILSNPIYIGKVAHRGQVHVGQHPAIVDMAVWEAVQAMLGVNRSGHKTRTTAAEPALLAGLLVDETGERLTSTHSRKNISNASSNSDHASGNEQSRKARRYRYYVSRSLMQTGKTDVPDAIRIPAQELEQVVLTRLHHFLDNGVEVLKILDSHGMDHGRAVHTILVTAERMAEVLNPARQDDGQASAQIEILQHLVEQIIVRVHELEFKLRLDGLIQAARESLQLPPEAWMPVAGKTLTHTILLQVQLKRSGLAVRVIVEPTQMGIRREANARLVNLLSRAYDWFGRITSGRAASAQEVAAQEQITRTYVARVIGLTFLAPDIVRAILEGRNPASLTPNSLMHHVPLPADWQEQRKLLGFRLREDHG